MKPTLSFLIFWILLFTNSCIDLDVNPIVTMSPEINYQAYTVNNKMIIAVTVNTNPSYIDYGNVASIFNNIGEIEIFDKYSGELLESEIIESENLNTISEIELANYNDLNRIIVTVSGVISVFADSEGDGKINNKNILTETAYYNATELTDILSLEQYPVIFLNPEISFKTYNLASNIYISTTLALNPSYISTGNIATYFDFQGTIQLYDELSGGLIKSSEISGSELSKTVTIFSDTTGFNKFVVIASGVLNCFGDVSSDNVKANDILLTSTEFYNNLEINLYESE